MAVIEQLSGLRNQQRPERLPYGSIITATNVVLDDTRTIETRFGYSKQLSLSGITDGFSPSHAEWSYVIANKTLYAVLPDLTYFIVASNLTDDTVQWAQQGDRTYYAGPTDCGMIQGIASWKPLRLPYPSPTSISLIAGDLPAGQYQITASHRHVPSGIASPTHGSISVDIEADGVSSIIVSYSPPTDYVTDLYITEPNDTQERFWTTVIGTNVAIFNAQDIDALGFYVEAALNLTDVLPTTNITALAAHNKCLYAAIYNESSNVSTVLWSEPGWPQIYRLVQPDSTSPLASISSFQGMVYGMASVDEGLLVGTDRALWLLDAEGNHHRLADYGVVFGRPFFKTRDGLVAINSIRGILLYQGALLPDGIMKFIPPMSDTGSTTVLDFNGMRLALVLTDGLGDYYNKRR
jgi:hypothetical protein